MKLSKETVAIMKNFAQINSNLLIKPGNQLSTISAAKSVYASATVAEDFDTQFGIYDLNEFLGVLSIFNDPELTFNEKFVLVSEGRNSVKFYSADEAVLVTPTKAIKVPPADISFSLSADQVAMISKTAGVLRAPDVIVKGDGSELKIIVGDKKNITGNSYEMAVGDTSDTFSANIRVDNMKIIPGDYDVEIAAKRIIKFSSGSVEYVLSLEADSVFED